ncbi:MAG: glutamate-5-semialdehyde dehydrogenase [Candidatus Pelagibacter sp.]|nr:glutamate-5-semialdehyde dehydrogenase [Candidatus Pelagibacter sp.]OUV86677.1 MAG: glutamate-5-semialdehyde dehydrogenase [Pelagibacteraceae bacterium TMED136]|tara:strand:- start:5394 stop:6653 length:1260 start_codon:yes stop_codon:yes gene_type:complete
MNKLNYIRKLGTKAKKAAQDLSVLSEKKKNSVLKSFYLKIKKNSKKILDSNKIDINNSKKNKLKDNLIDRSLLNKDRIKSILDSIDEVISFKDPTHKVIAKWRRPNNLIINRVTMPIGVLGVIYEARPNVTSDVAILSFKSGNSAILRGGKEALQSNIVISNLFRSSLKINNVNQDCIQLVNNTDRKIVDLMLSKMSNYLDIIIPRGGKGLVKKVLELSNVPTIGHLEGLCHVYLDYQYDYKTAEKIIFNSKLRRTSICGAAETLLIHKSVKVNDIYKILKKLNGSGCIIIGDKKIKKIFKKSILAKESDWSKEYLESKISVKIVDNINEAIKHIKKYGTNHTECIISKNKKNIKTFERNIDSSIVMTNASTQFADGYEFGLGSEVGISTNKMHPRGPVGLEQLVTYKYIVNGKGQIRS